MPATDPPPYKSLAEWAADRADMLIVCTCGRTINLPSGNIVERFRGEGSVSTAAIRLVCKGCGRRGHATLTPVPKLRR
ncbi:hypothetical protein [Sphingomonas solaris]|uniref:Uncharacterized protein n=1 Tax=Alterirhizorhabdus solaris TaxID=2529389 RepID=A0A558RCE8_9SPHN|nr:hypothetical protein [Sphingomonas solaris]TVV76922.1 hypothetical protein FOY91_02420 [Sphingomonas solaris]